MNEKIFRAKSLERIKSPESLNDYVRVLNPGVWLLLGAVAVLLAGALVWSVFGRIENVVPTSVSVEDGEVVCYIGEKESKKVEEGQLLRIGELEGVIRSVGAPENEECVCDVEMESPLPDGIYSAEIVTESVQPVRFILN